MTSRPHLVLVGGFLGAGKTSLIRAASAQILRMGRRPAVILNDQSDGLVDRRFIEANGFDADEVAGGCFCCRFTDLVEAAERLRRYQPDVIFAEPVGSCTDIAATTIRPLQLYYPEAFRISPFTVLVDPARAAELQGKGDENDMAFLFHKQIAEADIVCETKSDLGMAGTGIPNARMVSTLTGQGIMEWLDEVLSSELLAGQKTLEIDYARYAQAEAALTWLNWNATIELDLPLSPAMLLGPVLEDLEHRLRRAGIRIVHLKAIDECESGFVKAAVCGEAECVVEGDLTASPMRRHEIRVNLRSGGDPVMVEAMAQAAISAMPRRILTQRLACFRPAAPQPEHRLKKIV